MLESAHPLCEFETKQKGATYHLRLIRFADRFWLKRVDMEDWLAYLEDVTGDLQVAFHSSDEEALKIAARSAVQQHQLNRAFQWEQSERLFVLWKSSDHFWFDAHTWDREFFISRTPWHKSPFWTTTGECFRQRFEQEWQPPASDARDAFNYLTASPQEQYRYAVVWLHGGWEEVERVVSAAMKIEFPTTAALFQWPDSYEMRLEWQNRDGSTLSERMKNLLTVIDERNVRDPHEGRKQKRGGYEVEVSISTPSMHDKIEARLFLLDWLRKHAPQLRPDWT
ncbi:hypothetical protein IAD21_04258 [Abditibacteriota bacterium]|nr:hypothetical protein IAD21_04258 [Abditibacteriota bacterium]